jgi:hypothetical protein
LRRPEHSKIEVAAPKEEEEKGGKCRVLSDLAVNIIYHWGGGAKIPGFRSPGATKFFYSGP